MAYPALHLESIKKFSFFVKNFSEKKGSNLAIGVIKDGC